MTDQKYKDLMNGGWSYPKKESTDPEEVKKVVDKYLTDNKIDSLTIDKKITDGISKIVADAPEDFDTLKEMSDWISQHSDSAAAMNSDILDNKSSIETLQKDKANATDVETLSSEVENNTNDISDLSTDMKRIFKHKNLIGNTLDYYPVFIKSGSTITCSTYDGSVSSITEAVIEFYDKNKTMVEDRSSILSGNRSRTITLNSNDVYYVKWKTLPTIPIQMELGDRATSYEEYIDDYNFNAIVDINSSMVDINSSMSDYGLNNVFDGELVNGYHDWTNGNFVDNTTVVEIKKAISVNNGDTVSVKTEQVFEYICCVLFNGETYVSGDYIRDNNEFTFMITSDVNRVYVYFSKDATITPSTAGHIGVYVNNQIDVVKTDFDVLSGEVDERTTLNVRLTLEKGDLDENGIPVSSTEYKRTINYIKVKPNTVYTISRSSISNLYVVGFQAKGIAITDGTATGNKFIVYESTRTNVSFITTNTTQYIKVVVKNLDLSEKITIDASNSIGETVSDNTNAISEIKANITTNIYNLNDVVKGKWITDKNGSTGSSASWVYLPLNVKGLKTVTISALGGTASWNKHYFNDSNGTTIAYNNSQITASVPSDATILYVNIYEEFTDINAIKITTESVGEVVTDINASLSVLGKCKNLLKTTLGSGNGNGITYVNNGDGTYTLNGTCTTTHELHFNPALKLPYGKYKLLGTSAYQKTNNGEWRATVSSGEVFEVSESKPVLDVMAYISSGSVVNQTIKPMVTTNLNATENDFVPYTGDGDTLTADVAKVKNDVNVLKNDKEDKYTLELNHFTNCVSFENVVNTDEYFEAMVFDRSDKKKYIKVSGYRPSENAEENEISYIKLGSKTLNIVGSNNQAIMFSGGSEMYDAYIKAIR